MTFYANVINVRPANNEIVLEFGAFFPTKDQQFPPQEFPPEVRVVISRELLGPLVDVLCERLAPVPVEATRTPS